MIHKTRVLLIELGKILPFVVCTLVLISYVESIYSLATHNYVLYDNYLVLNKQISWTVGKYFEYNLTTVVIMFVISIAVETCIWNKMTILYLSVQLLEKEYLSDVELYVENVFFIVMANIVICCFLIWKGLKTLF